MYKGKIYHIILGAFVLFLSSCDDYLEKYPLDGPSSASFYSNEDELMMGLLGCYKGLNFEAKSGRPWPVILDVTTDINWNRSNHQMQHIGNGSHDSDNGSILIFWREFYQTIGRCNFLLDNIGKLEGNIPSEVYFQSIAEARFIRAISYHYLVELFGDVPLVTKTQTLDESIIPRSSKRDVVDFILNELSEAAEVLPSEYPADQYHGRATKGAALAIKARTALYDERWGIAAEAAEEVISLGYSLNDDFAELFTYSGQTSNEIIFSLQYLKGIITHATPNYLTSRLAGGVSNEVPPQSMVDTYECLDGLSIDKSPLYDPENPFDNRDPRLGMTLVVPGSVLFGYQFETNDDSVKVWNYNTSPPTRVKNLDATHAYATYTGYLYRKYTDIKDMLDDTNSELNISLIRFAEVLLIYAEAKIEEGELDESVYSAINQVRGRSSVSMPPILPGKTQAELRSIVRKERKYELANEGLRLMDIRRWKIAEDVMSGEFLGRIPNGYLSNPPHIDENGTPDYSNVLNKDEMRLVEIRSFDPDRDYLWPIPNIEILTNKSLEQNPKY
ncbi:RagB/SusD family nutrient uptake outer membrane protein [Echinicola shivajiensis]|uniref:RagB/SusD family nutrient uptake outer membrane protein n=1 Tax=Echinicola shivajiensis TaxID=1035916 RepID=UPI001BFCA559|nr:RagB/SusD family nutrient uptake outer membrane protein [Echinicola shivajiensis]